MHLKPNDPFVCKHAACGEELYVQLLCDSCLRVYDCKQVVSFPCTHCHGTVRPFSLDVVIIGCLLTLRAAGVKVPWTPLEGIRRARDYDAVVKMAVSDFHALLAGALAADPARLQLIPNWAISGEMLRAAIAKNSEVQPHLTTHQATLLL